MLDAEKLLAPLTGDSPCGESAKYEPEYEEVAAELGKLEALSVNAVDWPRVRHLASEILETRSKDLLIAVYLTWALYETEGYAGLAEGVGVCAGLGEAFWDDLYPAKRRMRGRVAAVEWLAVRMERALEQAKPGPEEAESVLLLLQHTQALDALFQSKVEGDSAPNLASPLRLLRACRRELEEGAQTASPPDTAPTSTGSVPSGAAVAQPLVVESEADVPKVLRQCQAGLRKVADFLSEKKFEDPHAFRLRRVVTWMSIDRLPADREGVTQLTANTKETALRLEMLLQGGDFRNLVNEAEAAAARSPFWLDPHRYSAMGLESMGPLFAQAVEAVNAEVAHFTRRFPNIGVLRFSDGTPFVDEATSIWLDSLLAATGSVSGEANDGPSTPPEPPWKSTSRETLALAAKGKFNEAAARFSEGLRSARSVRERFVWQLAQAEFCRAAGKPELALPQLERLDVESTHYRLEEWEPQLAVQVLSALLECQMKIAKKLQQPNSKVAERIDVLFSRLCGLDLEAVLSMELKK